MTKILPTWFILGATLVLTCFFSLSCVLSSHAQVDHQTHAWRAANQAARSHDFKLAVAEADVAIEAGLTQPLVFYYRARWNFRAGNIKDSLRDFDRFVKAEPERSNSQWERGITCFYANEFEAGAKQFVDYQNYHDNDVENAVWRYLCQAKLDGKEKAREAILPIKNDTRVPMMEIYRLFRGESTPKKVLDVLKSANASGELARREAFDAHLYLALYFDSEDDLPRATKHVDLAVKQFQKGDYMWAVAVEHQKHLRRRSEAVKDQGSTSFSEED